MTGTDVSSFLEPDEAIIRWFNAGSGPPWAVWLAGVELPDLRSAMLLPLTLILRVRKYWVLLTDRSVVVLRLNALTGKPHRLELRLPRRTQLGPFAGRGWIQLGPIRMFAFEVGDKQAIQAADEEMGFPRPVPGIW